MSSSLGNRSSQLTAVWLRVSRHTQHIHRVSCFRERWLLLTLIPGKRKVQIERRSDSPLPLFLLGSEQFPFSFKMILGTVAEYMRLHHYQSSNSLSEFEGLPNSAVNQDEFNAL